MQLLFVDLVGVVRTCSKAATQNMRQPGLVGFWPVSNQRVLLAGFSATKPKLRSIDYTNQLEALFILYQI